MPTGFELIYEAQMKLGEPRSTLAQLQSSMWPRHLRKAANRMARSTWCRYKRVYHDILQGQHHYYLPCVPFELRAVTIKDTSGAVWPIGVKTPEEMDESYWLWRTNPAIYTGLPSTLVAYGTNECELFYSPSYGAQNGLMLEGYYDYQDWEMQDEFPGDEPYWDCVLVGAQYYRCDELQDDPKYANKMKGKWAMFDEEMTDLYSHSVMQNTARRSGGPGAGTARLGPWAGGVY